MDASSVAGAVILGWILFFIAFSLFAFLRGRTIKMKYRNLIYPYSYYRQRRRYHRRRYLLTLAMSVVVAMAVDYVWALQYTQ